MDFGKVAVAELDNIDFTLPAEPASNAEALAKGKGGMKLYAGLSAKGKLTYPQYGELFNAVEYAGTFYGLPTKEILAKQFADVPGDFKFCPKFPQVISHLNRLKNVEGATVEAQDVLATLQHKLGPLMLTIHPGMGTSTIDTVTEFFKQLTVPTGLEVRHQVWFKEGYNVNLLAAQMAANVATIITDTAGRRDAVHMHLSTPVAIVRFVGYGLHPSDHTRLDAWAERLRLWREQGLEECYFFVHQNDPSHGLELVKYLKKQFGVL